MIAVLGECVIDLIDTAASRTFSAHVGGSPLNVAIGVRRLGHPTALLARFGSDRFGQLIAAHAADEGLDLSASVNATQSASLAVITKDSLGVPSYDFYLTGAADWQWSAEELATLPVATTLLHTGSLVSWLPPSAPLIATLMQQTRATGQTIVTYDPNVRAGLGGTPEETVLQVETCIAAAHVVKASVEDLALLYSRTDLTVGDLAALAQRWLALGPDLVVLTQGGDGATAYSRSRSTHRAALPVSLVDTVGAGDAFMAGLIAGLADADIRPGGLRQFVEGHLEQLLDTAMAVSAFTCEQHGANPPTRKDLGNWRASQ